MKLISKEDYKKLDTDLKKSHVVSNLMEDFPPICTKDPLDVRVSFILKHFETTRETIRMEDVLEDMYGGALPEYNWFCYANNTRGSSGFGTC